MLRRRRGVLALVILCHLALLAACANAPTPGPNPHPTAAAELASTATPTHSDASLSGVSAPARRVVALDPGHGGTDDSILHLDDLGQRYREGERTGIGVYQSDGSVVWEKDLNLELARIAQGRLEEMGYTVVLTRQQDLAVNEPARDVNGDGAIDNADELQARADIINASGADLFVSIHLNGFPKTSWRGTATFYCSERTFGARSRALADALHDRVWNALVGAGYKPLDRGVMDDEEAAGEGHLILLGPGSKGGPRPTRVPGALVEPLFLTNREEESLILRAAVRESLARAVADAIQQALR